MTFTHRFSLVCGKYISAYEAFFSARSRMRGGTNFVLYIRVCEYGMNLAGVCVNLASVRVQLQFLHIDCSSFRL